MNKKPDIVSLKWVSGLMCAQADSAETALVEYSNDPARKEALLRCMWAVHQITSTLKALGMHKAEMLTLEMERSLNFIYKGKLTGERRKLAMGGLMQALKVIPAYLEHTQEVRIDTGRGLDQYVNDLRRWSGQKPRPRAYFFYMDIDAETGITQDASPASDEEIKARANVLLAPFLEMAKQGLRRRKVGESMKTVARIARKMQILFAGTSSERFWFAMIGLCEGIAAGLIVPDECLAQIFKAGAFSIKHARESGNAIDDSIDYDGYLQQMLYYIATCRSKPVHIAAIREAFGISDNMVADQSHGLVHSDAIIISINGAMERLNGVIEFLSGSNPGSDSEALEDALEALEAAETRLIAAGQIAHGDSLAEVRERFQSAFQGEGGATGVDKIVRPIVDIVYDLEHKLKHGLGSSVSGRDFELRESVVTATFSKMGLIENHLHQILRRKSLKSALDKKPTDLMSTIALTTALQRYLNKTDQGHEELRQVVRDADNGEADLDQLYSLAKDFLNEQESIPDRKAIEDSLHLLDEITGALNFAGMDRESQIIQGCHRWLSAASDAGAVREDEAFRCFADAFAQIEMHMQRSLIDPLDDTSHMIALAEQCVAQLEKQIEQLSPGRQTSPVVSVDSMQESEAPLVEDGDIPPEFREVFIEESEEIVTELARLTAEWLNEPEVNEVLRDIRRHFHTFKGNGRAVGANILGELGWAAQDMLDRSLDGELEPGAGVQHLVSEVVDALPALVESYSKDEGPDVERIRQLTNQCFAMAAAGSMDPVADGGAGTGDSTMEPMSH
ncbi:MAG: Hpt domain-containing protein [Halioglobus sp.]|nr:Hpt domain-containing protein [Halioglobus sp.]